MMMTGSSMRVVEGWEVWEVWDTEEVDLARRRPRRDEDDLYIEIELDS
jgi:hypothetical protein